MKGKWMRLWGDERTWKQRVLLAVLPALLFAFNLFVFAPFDLFEANKQFLWFTYMDLLPAMLLLFGVGFLLLAGIGLLLRGALFNLYESAVYGVAVCLYLQGNFLNRHMGSLDGSETLWASMTSSMVINVLVWLLILAVPVVVLYFSKNVWSKLIKITACILVAMQVVTMATVWLTKNADAPEVTDNNKFFVSDGLLEVSEKKNAVVFILDMFDVDYMEEVMAESPDLFAQLDGFTYYPNTVGTHARTYPSVAQYFTGKLYNYDMPVEEYIRQAWEATTFFPTLEKNRYDIRVFGDTRYFPNGNQGLIDNYILSGEATYKVTSPRGLAAKWMDFVGYTYYPLTFKPFFSLATSDFDQFKGNMMMNGKEVAGSTFSAKEAYDALTSSTDVLALNDSEGSFRYFHFYGAHGPYNHDEEMVNTGNSTLAKQVRGNLKLIVGYIQNLKAMGLYDDTNIIITADHGNLILGNITTPPNPIFMMKPIGARGGFQTDQSPVWLMDLRKTILADLGLDASGEEGIDIRTLTPDTQRERYFYHPYIGEESNREEKLQIYKVTGDANDPANWELAEEHDILYSAYNT